MRSTLTSQPQGTGSGGRRRLSGLDAQYTRLQVHASLDCSEAGSGAKVRLIVEGVRSVQMVRGEAGGFTRFSALDGAEDLAMFRQGELLQARLADKIEVELDKPSKQRLTETREDRVAS